jgi:hypothetical protein
MIISAEAVRQEEVQKIYQDTVKVNLKRLEALITDVKTEKALSKDIHPKATTSYQK